MDNELLNKISDFKVRDNDALNIRFNGECISKIETENVKIQSKKNNSGLNIYISKNSVGEYVHIPAIINKENYNETVYNDFYIEDGAIVTIVSGCGIHNDCESSNKHSGVHNFHIGKNASVKYIEKHYAEGNNVNNKFIDTITNIEMEDNSELTIETAQISGIDFSKRITNALISTSSSLIINETLMTDKNEKIETEFNIVLDGKNSKADVKSKSVAKGNSYQKFSSSLEGKTKCFAHVSCDAIVMDNSKVSSTPSIIASSSEAEMSHEAVIGKIAAEQIKKLMTLGLTKSEAENKILEGFLK